MTTEKYCFGQFKKIIKKSYSEFGHDLKNMTQFPDD